MKTAYVCTMSRDGEISQVRKITYAGTIESACQNVWDEEFACGADTRKGCEALRAELAEEMRIAAF